MNDHAIYAYVPHQRTETKLAGVADGPVTVAGQLPAAIAWPASTPGSR